FLFGGIIFSAGCTQQTDEEDKDVEEDLSVIEPEAFGEVLLAGEYKRIYEWMSDEFKAEVSGRELKKLGQSFNEGVTSYNMLSEVPFEERATLYTWADDAEEKGLVVVMDDDGMIEGLQLLPLSDAHDSDDVYTETVFDLPFEDEWFVFWGGTNALTNYHYEHENQRYAYDFMQMKDKRSFAGDKEKNESYYAFGQPYLASADGTVVAVENNIADNEPVGESNEEEPLGNHVIIDHGNDEFSYLAHFKEGSIDVTEGDDVTRGDVLGQVGNSGNSSEPHIHFHVADSADPYTSKSIRIQLEVGDLVQGDTINN